MTHKFNKFTAAAWLMLVCSLPLFTAQHLVAAEQLPAGVQIATLEVIPTTLAFKDRYEYRQLLVTGKTAAGDKVDVTRLVKFSGADALTKTVDGLVRPTANGTGELILSLGELSLKVPVQVAGYDTPFHPSYVRDVMPILARNACNSGACHGGQDGKNGFKLSLRGYDPLFDHQALTDDHAGRRFNRSRPELSLMLQKPTGDVPHQGGVLLKSTDPHYGVLRDWIADGVKLDLESPRVARIELFPQDPQVPLPGMKQQMVVLAHYTDGAVRDVTAEAFIDSSLPEVVEVSRGGVSSAIRRGEAALLARFEGAYAATTFTVMGDRTGYVWRDTPTYNYIDELVYAKLKRVKLLPSDLSTDSEFLRRVYLDLVGVPPDPEVIRSFVADSRDPRVKREEVIDRLIGSPDYIEHWTHKWGDLLQVNRRYLGEKGAWALRNWLHQAVSDNMPYDQMVFEIVAGSGSSYENPGAAYQKIHREPGEAVENTTQLFLGVRFNCNKCHDHPFERWTQNNYYHLAAYFVQVARKKGPMAAKAGQQEKDEEVVFDIPNGEMTHLRTGQVSPPKFPFEHSDLAAADAPRRTQLAQWMTSKENQYFAPSFVNRSWSYFMGLGIIDPVDDIRAGNPATNPELLQRLSEEFVKSNFNIRELHRTICKSRVYQQSILTSKWNNDDTINFSHATARRLSAEVLIDTIHRSLGTPIRYAGLPPGFRASQMPDSAVEVKGGFLDLFGRPPRESPCECERSSGVMLSQALNLVNGPVVADAIAAPGNRIEKLVKAHAEDSKVVEELFLSILCRYPNSEELHNGVQGMRDAPDRLAGAQDVAWALINSPAFLFNR